MQRWQELGVFDSIVGVQVDLYGSLAKTGRGHMTDMAVMLGLSNEDPVSCDTVRLGRECVPRKRGGQGKPPD